MSKRKHTQKGMHEVAFVCLWCKEGNCTNCVDILRMVIEGAPSICKCKRHNHSGEARDQQILDPETGAVHGPGLVVDKDGTVTRTDNPDQRDSTL